MNSLSLELTSYQAVIFDMDGTLIDSSLAIREVFQTWCARHQLDLEQVLALCHGSRVRDFLGQLAPHLNPDEEDAWLYAKEATITTGIVAIPGARQMLSELNKRSIPWGIATSSVESVARARLAAAELPVPQVLVTGEQVKQGKPDPEHFTLAAEKLGAAPDLCLAFEDSPNGIASALAAGCDLVVVGDALSEHREQRIVARLNDYQPLLNTLFRFSS